MGEQFEVDLLGPIRARCGGVPIELPQGRARALLAVLALAPGHVVSTDRLIAELWGSDPPATVATALHGHVSGLRKRIDPDGAAARNSPLLVTRPPGYVLDVDPDRIDAHRFRALVRTAGTAEPSERATTLQQALAMWRGPALVGVDLHGPACAEAIALEEVRWAAYEDMFDAELALGHHHGLIPELEVQVSTHPLRERLYGQLMLAHYRCGRQSDALGVWQRARATLVDQVGVEPGPGLQRLHRAVLRQDPALELRTAAIPTSEPQPDAQGVAHEDARAMAARAGELLAAAGSRIFERYWDAATAEELFSRAEGLLPPDHPGRQEVSDRIPETHLMLGRHRDADARLTLSLAEARRLGDQERELRLRLERARIQLFLGPDPIPLADIEAVADQTLERGEAAGDDLAVSQACYVLTLVRHRQGRMEAMEDVARRGLAAAERTDSPREWLAARWMLALAVAEGPTPVDEAVATCEELARMPTGRHLGVVTEIARLHALAGRHDVAWEHMVQARQDVERRPGMRRPAMFVGQRVAEVKTLAGRIEQAEPDLRAALALADDLGEAEQRAQYAARLAVVLALRGSTGEARELAHRSGEGAPVESLPAQVLWRVAVAALPDVRDAPAEPGPAEQATAMIPDDMRLLAADVHAILAVTDLSKSHARQDR